MDTAEVPVPGRRAVCVCCPRTGTEFSPRRRPRRAHGSPPVSEAPGQPDHRRRRPSPPALLHPPRALKALPQPFTLTSPAGSAERPAVDVPSGSPWGSDWRCLHPPSSLPNPRALSGLLAPALGKKGGGEGAGAGRSTISRPRRALRKVPSKKKQKAHEQKKPRAQSSSCRDLFPSFSSPSPLLLHL